MRQFVFATALLALAAPASAEIRFAGGDGADMAHAIVIKGAAGEADGVAAEYDWLRANRPGANMQAQALLFRDGKYYDALTIERNGVQETVFFDISAFLGS